MVWGARKSVEWDQRCCHASSSSTLLQLINDEVTLQCDASETGLGAALLQLQQPVSFAPRALTSTETRYAQIQKELLAIVFACEKFDKYIFGRDIVHVETDHKPLEAIFKKSLCDASARLQRMLLRLQRYSLDVSYKKGPLMYIADTLSRAYRPETSTSKEVKSMEFVDHTENLRFSPPRLAKIEHVSAQDQVCTALRQGVLQGWPKDIVKCEPCLRPFFQFLGELTFKDNWWLSLIRSQCDQERNYVPCTLKSHRSERLSSSPSRVHVLASDELWRARLCLSVWRRSTSLTTIHRYENLCTNTKSLHGPRTKVARRPLLFCL